MHDADNVFLDKNKQKFAEYNSQYKEREAFFMAFQPQNVDICFWGDSITQRFPWQDYFQKINIANRGIGSDTTEGILARLDSVIALNPKVICILAGINDLSSDRTPEEITSTYNEILIQLQAGCPDVQIIVTSILPAAEECNVTKEQILETNSLLMGVCEELDISYLDVFNLLVDNDGRLQQAYAFDDVHLSVKGYQVCLKALCAMEALKVYKS